MLTPTGQYFNFYFLSLFSPRIARHFLKEKEIIHHIRIAPKDKSLFAKLCLFFLSLCSRAAVVRGQVITSDGMGLIGVRVSTTLPHEGFTMTRDNGWFDLMVNGGGPVMLQFGRNPYPPLRYHFDSQSIFFCLKVLLRF